MSRAPRTRRGNDRRAPSAGDRPHEGRRGNACARGARIAGAALVTTVAAVVLAGPASATWSVVGTDPATGQVGAAVASCTDVRDLTTTMALVPNSGGAVSVGAATDTAPLLLASGLRAGSSPSQVAAAARGTETAGSAALRQYGVAVLGAGATTATGGATVASGARVSADGTAAVQGNLVASPAVLDATKRAFDSTTGPLATRLVAALRAGSAAGGDRGCGADARAAAVVVLGTGSSLFVPAAAPLKTDVGRLLGAGDLTPAQVADQLAEQSVRPVPRGAKAPAVYLSAVVPPGTDALTVIEGRYADLVAAQNPLPVPVAEEIVDPSYSQGLTIAAIILFCVLGLVIAALIIAGLRRADRKAALAADGDADPGALTRGPFRDEVANLFDLDIAATLRRSREAERRRQVQRDKDRGRDRVWSGTSW